MSDLRFQSLNKLGDKTAREVFVDAHIRNTVAFQIRALRREEKWTQEKLAARAGTKPTHITRIENPEYGSHTISTLRKVASAFDVALIVRFVPFSELLRWDSGPKDLAPKSYWREIQAAKTSRKTRSDTASQFVIDFTTAQPMTASGQYTLIQPSQAEIEVNSSGQASARQGSLNAKLCALAPKTVQLARMMTNLFLKLRDTFVVKNVLVAVGHEGAHHA